MKQMSFGLQVRQTQRRKLETFYIFAWRLTTQPKWLAEQRMKQISTCSPCRSSPDAVPQGTLEVSTHMQVPDADFAVKASGSHKAGNGGVKGHTPGSSTVAH